MEVDEVLDSQNYSWVPYTPMDGGSITHFQDPAIRRGSVSSTPHSNLQPVSFDISEISSPETLGKDTESDTHISQQ